jgi:dTDP-glucose pyrophosphorylase
MNIVIPMAGAGTRFTVAGYETPKPFIPIQGKMMIEHVLESLWVDDARYILIVQEHFLQDYADALATLKQKFQVDLITVERLTQGAACTALACHELINHNEPVVFADADNFYAPNVFQAFLADAQARQLDGSLLTFPSQNPCFSYVEMDASGYAIRTREKEAISSHAICGVYGFSRGSDFVHCAIDMMIYGDTTKNEYYMSNVYNYAIKKGRRIGCFDIPAEAFQCVGTPEQLEAFLVRTERTEVNT